MANDQHYKSMDEHAAAVTRDMFNQNADVALQAAIEVMLITRSSSDVVSKLRSWADYLDERR